MKSPIFSFIISTLAWGLAPAQENNEEENTNQANNSSRYEAVVRIENSSLNPDYRSPWNTGRDSGGNGTGWLVGKNKFLTNAHVVSNSRIIYIKKVGDAKPYRAKIVHIAHDCDLAMLELEDPSAFEGVTPFDIGKLPQLDTTVKVIGYPIGGERISITSGVVSRIDFLSYSHTSVDLHLTIQIDAAINPGNSGGPVIQNGKVVGVAFQGYSGNIAQNTGYMIPTPVIRRFLKDVEDGNYDHYVDLSMSDFPLINPAQRKALGLANDGIGIMVAAAEEDGSAGGILKTGDVLLAIDGRPVKSNGLINYEGEDVNMNEIVERKFAGDVIKLKIWRQNKSIDTKVTLKRFLPYLIAAKKYDEKPRYIMFSGLVFQPLDRNLMAAHGMKNLQVRYHFDSYVSADIYKDRPEVIVLTSILPDSINSYFSNFKHSIVDKVNGVEVKTLKDAHNALAKNTGDYIIISLLGNGRPIVIERSKVEAAQKRIQEKYNVIKDHYLGD
ncbi:MAG: trypsin-like peptidase domain-containing protein [Verrucomicrobiales bacterium]|nr:trypsin-like peptidase domain-containing protein [Verrucomicrobiales bacterium]MEC7357615.1 trypsin-like peptidase domain-containing protein [Verrucomicrobiota bacterium]